MQANQLRSLCGLSACQFYKYFFEDTVDTPCWALYQLYLSDTQLSTLGLVWPTLMLTYLGQASYLISHPDTVHTAYYASVPQAVFWPMFVLAVLSAIIASQVHQGLLAEMHSVAWFCKLHANSSLGWTCRHC